MESPLNINLFETSQIEESEEEMRDKIYSESDKRIFAIIDIYDEQKTENGYNCKILEDHFPEELKLLIQEYIELANDQCFSLLDPIEEQINLFEMKLVEKDEFINDIWIDGHELYFTLK